MQPSSNPAHEHRRNSLAAAAEAYLAAGHQITTLPGPGEHTKPLKARPGVITGHAPAGSPTAHMPRANKHQLRAMDEENWLRRLQALDRQHGAALVACIQRGDGPLVTARHLRISAKEVRGLADMHGLQFAGSTKVVSFRQLADQFEARA
jgi:hypothetical protein